MAFVMYQKYQLKDLATVRNTTWKTWANVMKVILFVGLYLEKSYPSSLKDYLLAGCICALVFEFGINLIALKMPLFYIGKSSKFDKLGKYKWAVLFVALIISLLIKFL